MRAARLVDSPALAGGVARPHERNRPALGRSGAEPAHHRLAEDQGLGQILEPDAVEYVLACGQVLDERLGGKIAFRQGVDDDAVADLFEGVRRRNLDPHARGPVGARPDDTGIDRYIARLHAMGDERPARRKTDIRLCNAAECGRRCRRGNRREKPEARETRAGG
jgi:hypothetical protein